MNQPIPVRADPTLLAAAERRSLCRVLASSSHRGSGARQQSTTLTHAATPLAQSGSPREPAPLREPPARGRWAVSCPLV